MIVRQIQGVLWEETATVQLAQYLAPVLQQQQTQLHLEGPLGAGKTSLIRGLLRAWGHRGSVKSPTYTLVETYSVLDFLVLHIDLYRLKSPEETVALGLQEAIGEARVVCIEWPCLGLPQADITCTLDFSEGNEGRTFVLQAHTVWGEMALERLARALPHTLQWNASVKG